MVDREVETVRTVKVVQHHTRTVEVPVDPRSVADWAALLERLTKLIDSGRIYDRSVPTLVASTTELIDAINRRAKGSMR